MLPDKVAQRFKIFLSVYSNSMHYSTDLFVVACQSCRLTAARLSDKRSDSELNVVGREAALAGSLILGRMNDGGANEHSSIIDGAPVTVTEDTVDP